MVKLIVGDVVGDWKVIDVVKDERGRTKYQVECVYGDAERLTRSNGISLLHPHEAHVKVTVGDTFGSWTAISQVSADMWLCSCNCGSEEVMSVKTFKARRRSETCSNCKFTSPFVKVSLGHRFGDYTVIETEVRHPSGKGWAVRARCVCGTERVSSVAEFRRTGRCSDCTSKNQREAWYEKIDPNVYGPRKVYREYRAGAQARELDFHLELNDFFIKTITSDCHYCSRPPFREVRSQTGKVFLTGGIDRVDSGIGYIEENYVPCCSICNTMKRDMTIDEFRSHIKLLAGGKW